MKKASFTLITLFLCTSLIAEQETITRTDQKYRGSCEDYDSRDASVLSMMGWGIGIAIGIAALCALIDNNPSSKTD